MPSNAYQNYFQNEVLTAPPIKLVVLLYRGAVDAVRGARGYLAAGDIQARSWAITRATELVVELLSTLDYQNGGDISANLGRLYDYILSRLNEANSKQIDAPLAEAERLLQTLLEAWEQQAQTPDGSPSHEERYEYA